MLESLLELIEKAAKTLHLDASHDALRSNIQKSVSAAHYAANPDAPYYEHPYIRDVYGDTESGQVVYTKGKGHVLSNFKKGKDGNYTLSDHKPVKMAYVSEANGEPTVLVDGEPLAAKEAATVQEEALELREAAFDAGGIGMIKLIAPGQGSTGYYSEEVLKQAAEDGVFHEGLHMYIDHQTEQEAEERPENSVRNLAAVLQENAKWLDKGFDGPGLYAKAKAYTDFMPFLNERAKDIGVSIRALGTGKKGQVEGRLTRVVTRLLGAKSVDFVTRAGAGGKLRLLLESFRKERQPAAQQEQTMAKVEIEESDLKVLRESAAQVPGLVLNLERLNGDSARHGARAIAVELLESSGLPASAQKRVLKFLVGPLSTVPVTDGVLDAVKFTEAAKEAIKDETAYLTEAGVKLAGVKGVGGKPKGDDEDDDEDVYKESAKDLDKSLEFLTGIKTPVAG